MTMRLLLMACLTSFAMSAQVKVAGKAKNVMMGVDLSPNIWLDSIVQPGVYGLGPVDDLQGEITIFDGAPYVSTLVNGEVVTAIDQHVKAPFFVYAQVDEWHEYTIEASVNGLRELQNVIDELGASSGLDGPFPFRVQLENAYLNYHIIMRDLSEAKHSHEAHKKAKVHFEAASASAELLGFFSRDHEGVFTHKGQFIHTHILLSNPSVTGHLDDINVTGSMTIFLPRNM